MDSLEIISLIVTFVGVASFSAIFTILYASYSNATIREIKSGTKDVELINEVIYERQDKVKRRKERRKILKDVTFFILLIIVVPVFIFSVINKITKNTTMLGDKGIIVVASGSMSEQHKANDYLKTYNLNNQFNTYDIIVISKVTKNADIKPYDVIAFVNNEGTTIIHRIREIRYEAGGICYVTRGDSNDEDDEYKPRFDDIVGVYTNKRISGLGAFVMFFQSYSGIVTVVSIVYCMIMIDRMSNRINKVQAERVGMLEEAIDYSEEKNTDKFSIKINETIYFDGYAYYFDSNGFIKKEQIDETKLEEKVVIDEEITTDKN